MFGNSKVIPYLCSIQKRMTNGCRWQTKGITQNRYGTIMRRIEELCNQRDRFVWDKPQADHSEKGDYLEKGNRFFRVCMMI